MGNALVRASLKSAWVKFNGDIKDKLKQDLERLDKKKGELAKLEKTLSGKVPQEKIDQVFRLRKQIKKIGEKAQDNAIVCKLSYPRSGSSSIESIKAVRLPKGKSNGKPPVLNPNPIFLKHGLFKEEIQGEALLQVAVTDSDAKNAFLSFFRRVISTVFSSVTGGFISGLSGVVTSGAATVLSKEIAGSLTGSGKDKVQVVAVSKKVQLSVDSSGALRVDNAGAPGISYQNGILKVGLRTPQILKNGSNTYLKRGAKNGEVELALEAEPA